MNIEIIKTIIKIREYTLLHHHDDIVYMRLHSDYYLIYHQESNTIWRLPSIIVTNILDNYFHDGKFISWLNHKVNNPEFEKEIQRYLDLKAFI